MSSRGKGSGRGGGGGKGGPSSGGAMGGGGGGTGSWRGGGGGGPSRYQQQLKGGRGGGGRTVVQGQVQRATYSSRQGAEVLARGDEIDAKFGFERLREGPARVGWLLNYLPVAMPDETGMEKSGLDLYFLDREGGNFKATIFFDPYFYLVVQDPRRIMEISQHLQKRFEGVRVETAEKEDLDMANHLSPGKFHKMIKLSFNTVSDLMDVKQQLRIVIQQNQKRSANSEFYEDEPDAHGGSGGGAAGAKSDPLAFVSEMREYDVPYTMRVSIDLDLRVGAWFDVAPVQGSERCNVTWKKDMLELCEPRVLAFDIECEKSPLKFPNAENDRIYMISYMVAGQGFLLVNREVVTEDVPDFEYTPEGFAPGNFVVMNLPDEELMLRKFVSHVQQLRPHVFVTYNGDFFDWPYVEARCAKYADLDLYTELGVRSNKSPGNTEASTAMSAEAEYTGRCIVHLDAFCWVKRDSYLPQGNQGLKAVTREKLGYNPVEIDPEDMLREARERPQYMASYSVSDAVATYYLYTTYVHNFIFSLCTIIPMDPEDVLRKGSGTLCEALLMVEAFRGNIVCPNKQVDALESFFEGRLLESETYIGGHVECLEAGVFRSDIPAKFSLVPSALQGLISNVDRDLTFALETENGIQRSDILNYDEVRQSIVEKLEMLRDSPNREEPPIIYHLDVGAMYPNIILTNRLQPAAMVSQNDCAACDFNRAENGCKRPMTWTWRGDFSPASQSEYQSVKRQLQYERIDDRPFTELSEKEQAKLVSSRLKKYSHRVYKKTKVTREQERVDTVCMRENAFYVNTVRAFRDRRYDYKLLTKQWAGKKREADKRGDVLARKEAEDKEVLMDSLQLAHKCILNSFYGYVMRKGARWRSMEMAGIVTHTGANLITQARELVEQVGRPLELDTDGIWCILPKSFPRDFTFTTKKGGKVNVGYPCAMLNADVHERYTNHQYQDLAAGAGGQPGGAGKKYATHSECSIFFELDGPYHAMVLPASPEEGKLLKKKYVVFDFKGNIKELKGYEIKRRGELELVKTFQAEVFSQFLEGKSLEECYAAVGDIANQKLDIIDSCGRDMDDDELMMLISEKKTISKTLEDYEGRKQTSLTTAARLADFLGPEMVRDKGLNCNLIISRYPSGAPVTERAIPVVIFSEKDPQIRRHYLRKWLKEPTLDCDDFRELVDWSYYRDRLGKTIQKIITIPAGLQRVNNPCPRIEHPAWLQRSLADRASGKRQATLTSMFAKVSLAPAKLVGTSTAAAAAGGGSGADGAAPGSTFMMSPQGKRGPLAALASPAGAAAATAASAISNDKKRHRALSFGDDTAEEGQNSSPNAMAPIGDLEDIGAAPGPRGPGRPVAHFRKSSGAAVAGAGAGGEGEGEETEGEPVVKVKPIGVEAPETAEDLQKWLAARKKSWRTRRTDRRRERREMTTGWTRESYNKAQAQAGAGGDSEGGPRKKPLGVQDLVRGAALSATFGYWQVFELQETDAPGEFICWALTNKSQLQRLKVVMPRTLYVNCMGRKVEESALELGGARVKRDLPHARPQGNLYEVQLSERKFQRNDKVLSEFLNDPQIEGVYESQTPLWLRGVLQLGCVSRVAKADKATGGGGNVGARSYKLGELEFVNTITHPYLTSATASFRRVFLYSAEDKQRNSGLGAIGLFFIDGSNADDEAEALRAAKAGETPVPASARAFVWIVGGTNAQDSRPSLQRAYRRFQKDERATVKFVTLVVPSMQDAFRNCSEKLSDYQRERHGPSVVVAQGSLGARQWRRQIPALNDFPLATMPANTEDEKFPALLWQTFVGERMVQRFLIFPRWFADRLDCARYAHVPLCNLGSDALTTIIDVVFARQLQHNRHLLWASDGPAPDIGGAEADQFAAWSDALSEEQINTPGAYRNVCVELDLYGLDVCAIMSSGVLDAQGITSLSVNSSSAADDAGGAGGAGGDGPGAAAYTGATFSDSSCARAFNLLKSLVTKWIDDVRLRGDVISDSILTALYRYLCGFGDGMLYDPALHRVVYGLMTKLFKRLIGELRRLGAKVIYADFRRVVLDTGKHDLRAASEYTQFLLSAIAERETFSAMEITPKCYWEQLLWLGPENCGGILLTPESEAEQQRISQGADGQGEGEGEGQAEGEQGEGEDEENGEGEGEGDGGETGAAGAKDDDDADDDARSDQSEYHDYRDDVSESSRSSRGSRSEARRAKKRQASRESRFVAGHELDGVFSDDEDDDEDGGGAGGGGRGGANGSGQAGTNGTGGALADEDPFLQANWNLASYLPPPAAVYFHHIVSLYLYKHRLVRQALCRRRDARVEELSLLQSYGHAMGSGAGSGSGSGSGAGGGSELGGADTATTYAGDDAADALLSEEGLGDAVNQRMQRWLQGKLLDDILRVVDEPEVTYSVFPRHAGSHLELSSPPLELVKAVTHVLSLDGELENEVKSLRRALLAHLRVREFDAESNFRDPCLSFVLRDVICSYCSTCRDMDLLRDLTLTNPALNKAKRWRCAHCENGLDTVEVENRLLQEVERLSTAFLLQDAYCSRTKMVNSRLCAATSDLAAALVMQTPPEALRAQLRTLLRVAAFHDFKLLAATIEELL